MKYADVALLAVVLVVATLSALVGSKRSRGGDQP
jgi:hypothetical protein